MAVKLLILFTCLILVLPQYRNPKEYWDGLAFRKGHYTEIKKYPFVVSIHYKKSQRPVCTGVLVSAYWVLSVPLCFMITSEHFRKQSDYDNFTIPPSIIEQVKALKKRRLKRMVDPKPEWLNVPEVSSFVPFHFNLSLNTSIKEISLSEIDRSDFDFILPPSLFEVWAGVNKLQECNSDIQIRDVERIVIHDGFNLTKRPQRIPLHELALAKVATPFILMWGKALKAPFFDFFHISSHEEPGRCKIVGWGKGKTMKPPADGITTLSVIDVQLYNSSFCRNIANAYFKSTWNDDLNPWFCSYDNVNKVGAPICQSDSGSPLVCDDKVVALVSWFRSPSCYYGTTEYFHYFPALYSNIYVDLDWINYNSMMKTSGALSTRIEHLYAIIFIHFVNKLC